QQPNGAIANSPATTAYLAIASRGENKKALAYLDHLRSLPGYVPAFYPWNNFEISWVMQHLSYSGISLKEFGEDLHVWKTLQNALHDNGLGFDDSCVLFDGDTTSVAIHVLRMGGYDIDPMILKTFEHPEKHIFHTFKFERNMSVATNVHALEALTSMPDYPNREQFCDTIIRSLLQQQLYQSFWIDKFHVSPYYVTSHIMIALITLRELSIVEYSHSIEWFKHTQHSDGSWGYFKIGTIEETAYTLLALMYYHEFVKPLNIDILHRGIEFLENHNTPDQRLTDLWIAKTNFSPPAIVDALLLATFERYRNLSKG
ncbi:MAG TPA: hypothetical protein VJZ27_13395, partial [Aggregatilineales bacterium]|nr:hypothetical protein [Aggregatilineales bacterium]